MRKLVESTFVTLDGVISDPQVWSPPYWDDEHAAYASSLLFEADALLLGRNTYEGFVPAWPSRDGEYADRINALPKHVASRTLTETSWNATLLEGDVAEAVESIKAEPGENILKFGTGELDRARSWRTGSSTSCTSGCFRSSPEAARASSLGSAPPTSSWPARRRSRAGSSSSAMGSRSRERGREWPRSLHASYGQGLGCSGL